MNIKSQLRNSYPNNIDKTSEIFSALVANDKGTAVFESLLNDLIEYMHEWYSTPSLYEQTGDQLDRTISFFSYLKRFTDESDQSIKNRIAAIFIRNHDTSWGSKYNIKKVFEQYFPSGNIFVVENSYPIADSLIKEGDFISHDLTFWETVNVIVDERARFSKSNGAVLIGEGSSLRQTVDVDSLHESTYYLHFFAKGKCDVEIKDSNGRYWNNVRKIWQTNACRAEFSADEWDGCSLWYSNFSEGNQRTVDESIKSVSINFTGTAEGECYIDYVRLFYKFPYPSFTLIAQFTSSNSFGAMAVFPGHNDPVEGESSESYGNASYYNGSYMTGVAAGFAQDIYQDLLDYLRASGVRANIEIVTKDVLMDS